MKIQLNYNSLRREIYRLLKKYIINPNVKIVMFRYGGGALVTRRVSFWTDKTILSVAIMSNSNRTIIINSYEEGFDKVARSVGKDLEKIGEEVTVRTTEGVK